MDLDDVRASLVEQGWTPRPGKGTHVIWKPPDGKSRPVTISNGWNGRRLANLRSTLRKAGWIDPERIQQSTTVRNTITEPAFHLAPATAEGSNMTPAERPTVVEEAWATNSHTRRISDCIKEQLLSDGTVRYRCAHSLGGGCTYTSDRLAAVAAHQRLHRLPDLTSKPVTRAVATGRRGLAGKTARERTDDARDSVERQIEHTVKLAVDRSEEIRTHAILPYGLGAGAVTKTVWLIADPTGEVAYECGEEGCTYRADGFGSVFSHRSRFHKGGGQTARRAVTAEAPAAATAVTPKTAVGSALVEALQQREAAASIALDRDPHAQTISVEGPVRVHTAPPVAAAPLNGHAVATPPKPAPPASSTRPVAATAGRNEGGSFQDAVQYLREELARMVDHLRVMAAAEYDRTAAAREREEELVRLRAQMEEARLSTRAMRNEIEELKAERAKLLADHNQLEQLRGILGKSI